jgi:hypothetical protein
VKRKPSIPKLRRECDRLWTAIIRRREETCIVCRKNPVAHAHHIFAKSRHAHLRHDLRNGAALCGGCHQEAHHNPVRPVMVISQQVDDFGKLFFDAYHSRPSKPINRQQFENIKAALLEVANA